VQGKGAAGRKEQKDLADRIQALKEERDAVILAHNYQVPEVQDLADLVGDSLELSRAAADRDEAVIVFCGVDFMAETAAILSPEKTVLLPAADACCPMAEMVTAGEVKVLRERYPGAAVVCYVNTTAEVKAASDICCTSANAVCVVQSLEEERVIFVPDRNLALYTARFTGKEIIPWEGFCIVHDRITPEEVQEARHRYPGAEVLVHPECRPEVIDLSDHVFSTSGMVRHVCESGGEAFIIGTETGILYPIRKRCPGRRCFPLSAKAICTNMKKTTPEKVLTALETMDPRVTVPEEVARGARAAIGRMLSLP
jgi:quinolinate synthase